MSALRIGHYYPTLFTDESGVTAAIKTWAETQRLRGHDVVFLSEAPDSDANLAVRHFGRRRITRLPVVGRATLSRLDVLVLHEGWTPSHYTAAMLAQRAGTPYIVMPHGVYEPRIVARLKAPRTLRRAAERWMLEAAMTVHVFFETEDAVVRGIAPNAHTLVLPTAAPQPLGQAWTGAGRYLAWFGRYDNEHKGLDLLLEGLARVPAEIRPTLRLRGLDYRGGRQVTERIVASLGLNNWVEVGGPVRGSERDHFVAEAAAYVHPSRWESHSIALLEVLGCGAPALVSAATHIAPALARNDAAVLVPATAEGWSTALGSLDLDQLRDLGRRGQQFVQGRLAMASVGEQFDEALEELLSTGE